MTVTLDLSLVPPLGEPRPQPVPAAEESTLRNGLRVVVVPRPGVPLIELRLRVPFAASSSATAHEHTALGAVLSGAVLLGTTSHDQNGIAELLQSHGAELSVSTDPDRLLHGDHAAADRARPGARRRRRAPHRRHLPRRPRRGRAGPGRRADRHRPFAAECRRPRRAGRAPLRRPSLRDRAARGRTGLRRRRRGPPGASPRARPSGRQHARAGRRPRARGRGGRRRRCAHRLVGHGHRPGPPARARRCTRPGSNWSTVRGPCSPTSGSGARRRPAPIPIWPPSAWPT